MTDQTIPSLQHRLDKALADTALQLATIIEGTPRVRWCETHGVGMITGSPEPPPFCYWAKVYDTVNESHTKGTCQMKTARLLIEEEE